MSKQRTVLFPAFSATVAEQMGDYRERIAERIRIELGRRGEQPKDLAYRIDVHPRTVENWLSRDPKKQRKPQGKHLKAVADDFGIPIEELNPDLAAEEQALREWMERVEQKLDQLIEQNRLIRLELARPSRRQNTPAGSQGRKRASGS